MILTQNDIFLFIGFLVASYACVANDAIQTLGTFLSSNAKRPWWVLWIYAGLLLLGVFFYGWVSNHGDVTYGRLGKFPSPEGGFTWVHAVPAICVLALTRLGAPVSTTFLILTVFTASNLPKMVMKSLMGYGVAFAAGLVIYLVISKVVEKRFIDTDKEPQPYWVALQWASTGFLWSQWLMQDMANIFIYMPRQMDGLTMMFSVTILTLMLGLVFYRRGGPIQKIVTSKTNTMDIRSATIIDFIYAFILLFFKELSNIPMSTTWVFLGLLAGRELGMSLMINVRSMGSWGWVVLQDTLKALLGLVVSVVLALALPRVDLILSGQWTELYDAVGKVVEVLATPPE